jgi:hypothetical protein
MTNRRTYTLLGALLVAFWFTVIAFSRWVV